MGMIDDILALIRLEERLGYNATQLRMWILLDRCCHARAVITPKPLW